MLYRNKLYHRFCVLQTSVDFSIVSLPRTKKDSEIPEKGILALLKTLGDTVNQWFVCFRTGSVTNRGNASL